MAVLLDRDELITKFRTPIGRGSKPVPPDFTVSFPQALLDREAVRLHVADHPDIKIIISNEALKFLATPDSTTAFLATPSSTSGCPPHQIDWSRVLAIPHGDRNRHEGSSSVVGGQLTAPHLTSSVVSASGATRGLPSVFLGYLTVTEECWRSLDWESESESRLEPYKADSAISRLVSSGHGRSLVPPETEEFERWYQQIGWWRGPNATAAVRKLVRSFWMNSGRTGAKWLIERIDTESHIDVLDGVANLLADIGPTSIDPIINKLKATPTRDQVEVLLKALGWVEAPRHAMAIATSVVENTLQGYLLHPDSDIRSAACAATRVLPRNSAIALLDRTRRVETDSEVLEAIDEAIERRESDQSS